MSYETSCEWLQISMKLTLTLLLVSTHIFILCHQSCRSAQFVGPAAPGWATTFIQFWGLPGQSDSPDPRGQPGEEGHGERSQKVLLSFLLRSIGWTEWPIISVCLIIGLSFKEAVSISSSLCFIINNYTTLFKCVDLRSCLSSMLWGTFWAQATITSEFSLYRKAATHDDEIQRLYEEMELQIKNEKDRIVLQVQTSCGDVNHLFLFVANSIKYHIYLLLTHHHLSPASLFSPDTEGLWALPVSQSRHGAAAVQ